MKNLSVFFVLALALLAIFAPDVLASAGGSGDLPYESALSKVTNSLTGPLAYGISLLGILVAGGTLMFGGDLQGFVRQLLILVLVISVIVGANAIMSSIFGKGALVEYQLELQQ